jgi:hypothetical protein
MVPIGARMDAGGGEGIVGTDERDDGDSVEEGDMMTGRECTQSSELCEV